MAVEIRAVGADEAVDFLRAVPGLAGRPNWEPEPPAWWAGPGQGPAPGPPATGEELARSAATLPDLDRTRAAYVDGKLVGTSQTLTLELTVPGRGPVPMGGVTSVGVLPTHRRRGLLRAMMAAMLDDCRARGEALSALSASEGGIYGRYGFGPATYCTRWELERSAAPRSAAPPDLEFVDAPAAATAWAALHDRVRRTRIGEVSAYPGQWEERSRRRNAEFVVHRDTGGTVDGAAVYATPWSPDRAEHGTVRVDWLEAATTEAYDSLWSFLTGLDLTRRVVAAKRPVDEAFRWRLADPRAMRVTRQCDDLWVRLVDVPAALADRAYQVDGDLVIDLTDAMCPWNEGRWLVEGGPGGASCARTTRPADLALNATTLGSIYLGGQSLGPLVRGGLIDERTPGAITRATTMLTGPEAPRNAIGF